MFGFGRKRKRRQQARHRVTRTSYPSPSQRSLRDQDMHTSGLTTGLIAGAAASSDADYGAHDAGGHDVSSGSDAGGFGGSDAGGGGFDAGGAGMDAGAGGGF